MSLIEQLGGYDRAKEKYKEIDCNLNNFEFCGGGSPRESMYERLESIEKALLEYRRQHNIFEPDDWIIFENELMVFARWSRACPGHAYIGYAYAEDGLLEPKSSFRHATDLEIEDGHRI